MAQCTIKHCITIYVLPDRSTKIIMLTTEENLIETADRCIRQTRKGRVLIERLEAISDELMAHAGELDTTRDKNERDDKSTS